MSWARSRSARRPGSSRPRAACASPASTKLVRKGKKVSAQLALRLVRKLADSTLEADVVATDVKGARQVARAAASIQVSD